MNELATKRILIGVSGGIAAFKSIEIVRRLSELGANIRVMMTQNSTQFISPLTFQALTNYPVRTDLFDLEAERAMSHIELARWADLILIAPASANCVAKLANGICDDLLTTVCLASDKPLVIAPAMNRLMWQNRATKANIKTLKSRQMAFIEPSVGFQACGEYGPGRMAEVETIVDFVKTYPKSNLLQDKKVIITAGPTREAIDPVRYITNHSSGKMGYALAEVARNNGANVILITGPTHIQKPFGVDIICVETAEQMHQNVMSRLDDTDIFISAAAVCDYRINQVSEEKIKKNKNTMTLELISNPDIVSEVVKANKVGYVVGFAAETNDVLTNARDKLSRKNLSMIIANHVGGAIGGFNCDENEVTLLTREEEKTIKLANKRVIASEIIEFIAART